MKVFTNGCFDVLHRGHVELLSYCANIGEVVVGLNSDKSVRRLKGNSRPINNQDDRRIILESIKYVSEVVIFEEDTPYELIKILKPDLIVKGGDYLPNEVVGYDLAEVRIFDTLKGYSSTTVIESLLADFNLTKNYHE
jgi:D-beta-D-heptose 7-phosphate kinase/D-beta-D-heptose 1-phosphate adenosyltransferase